MAKLKSRSINHTEYIIDGVSITAFSVGHVSKNETLDRKAKIVKTKPFTIYDEEDFYFLAFNSVFSLSYIMKPRPT